MQGSTLTHTVPDGTVLHVHRWLPDGPPRAIVQIAHGMVEHAARYAHLGERLAGQGYAVYASDHRGHGRTAGGPDELGHLGDEHGFADAVDDLVALTDHLREEHPGVPVVLLGHSMGSFLARAYAARYGDRLAGLVLSGTAPDPGVLGAIGVRLAELEVRLRGPRARSPLLEALTLGPSNRPFRPNRTRYDWLSRDEAQVDSYAADELCGGVATTAFYRDLLTGLRWVSAGSTYAAFPSDLPVHLVSGGADPLGGAPAVEEVSERLRRAGVRDVTTTVWPGARHEVFNEINRDEVEDGVLAWLEERL
ncbi:alpha/beta hydrolase [Ornithinimicrobium humiphilum]|uniref:Alpha-beta hydrolase superfamily lysophospholipase n=1 Tax=Ornithinimicrobium humiphilum TaxID=125288 RepID=A0A543KNG0_9MICO|nr:alpha/beta hydrolase [Ornithinimicrobium humiphilum]TQM96609.1 alpha-beta hydrolase superfamily lysophospholipase [Ornithinimicrobium humiphilum]